MNTIMRAASVVAFVLGCPTAYADSTPLQETNELVQTDLQKATGADHLGDSVDLYTGTLSLSHTDVSLPGNSSLKVAVTRRFATGSYDGYGPKLAFGSWELDVPKLETLLASGGNWPANRCSSQWLPPTVNWVGTWYLREEYWQGFALHLPGIGSRVMLRANGAYPAKAGTKWVANGNVVVTCGTGPEGDGTPTGEGYVVWMPDGTRYIMNLQTSGPAEPVWKEFPALTRYTKRMLATKAIDRFGNYVNYNYTSGQLTSIVASDGRQLNIAWTTYNGQSVISTVTDPNATNGPRVWTYAYANDNVYGATELRTVVQPDLTPGTSLDNSRWTFHMATVYLATIDEGSCGGSTSGWMTSPFGLTATYTVSCKSHGHAALTRLPSQSLADYNVMSLTSKVLTGPGLTPATQTWTYAYSQTPGWYSSGSGSNTKWIDVTDPGNVRTRYTYNMRWDYQEGNLETIQVYENGSTLKRTTTMTYAWTAAIGMNGMQPNRNDQRDQGMSLHASSAISQGGDVYHLDISGYNAYRYPSQHHRYLNLSDGFYETKAYQDDTALWVIGEVASTSIDSIPTPIESTTFNAKMQPENVSAFGYLQATMAYDLATGVVSSVDDPVRPATAFADYYRGKARTVTFGDGKTQQITVNNEGTIATFTSENTHTTSYTYDALNRLTQVTFPSPDTQAWLPRNISYAQLTTAELGIPVGSWRMRTNEGNFQKTIYYDAQLNPVLTEEKDITSGPAIYVRRTYDLANRKTFQSYPSASYTNPAGVESTTDALGRLVLRQATPDGSVKTTIETIEYLANNERRVTDGDGKVRTTRYQAFDTPEYSKPTLISAMEGQGTVIERDDLGKITSITQSGLYQGNTLTATRTFTYDDRQRPCRRIDPESGSTVWGYDDSNQVIWEARGQSGTGCLMSAPVGAAAFGYDDRGRKILDNYVDPADDVTYGYDFAGNLTSVSNTTAIWTYTYNKRNLIETEQAVIDGRTLVLDPDYNNIARISSLTTPARTIAYVPDVWGRPTQVAGYVNGIQYHPNSALSSYSLASGVTYNQELNWRLRPYEQRTQDGTTVIQKYQYGYSVAGNLENITDLGDGSDTATLTYDDLHRLETATNTIWGAYSYEYDPLNNLRSRSGTSGLTYNYDTSNRLSTITGSQSRTYSYTDLRDPGWITGDGLRAFTLNALGQIKTITAAGSVSTYDYDGNAKRIKVAKADGTVEYALYNRAGALVYTEKGSEKTDYLQAAGQTVVELKLNGGTTTPLYLHPDVLGSPRKATNDSKVVQWQEHYDPYGHKLNGVAEKVGYTGHAHDSESGFTYMQARFYDAAVGRFLSTDPVYFADENPFTFNRYSYVNNNPYRYTDPTGMIATQDGVYRPGEGQGFPETGPSSSRQDGSHVRTQSAMLRSIGLRVTNSTAGAAAAARTLDALSGKGWGYTPSVLDIAGKAWGLPNTLVGLLYGGIGHAIGLAKGTNPGIDFDNNAVQFTNNPLSRSAITLGNVIVYSARKGFDPMSRGVSGGPLGIEEMQHTYQSQVLGPLYLVAHGLSGSISFLISGDWHNSNMLETGPHSTNPRPWP